MCRVAGVGYAPGCHGRLARPCPACTGGQAARGTPERTPQPRPSALLADQGRPVPVAAGGARLGKYPAGTTGCRAGAADVPAGGRGPDFAASAFSSAPPGTSGSIRMSSKYATPVPVRATVTPI